MKAKQLIGILAVVVMLVTCVVVLQDTYQFGPTYTGKTDVSQLQKDPNGYTSDPEYTDPNGIAGIIIDTNLQQTMAANDVAPIVFDYRGYDTLGESFILLTAIAGSYVILSSGKHGKKEGKDQ